MPKVNALTEKNVAEWKNAFVMSMATYGIVKHYSDTYLIFEYEGFSPEEAASVERFNKHQNKKDHSNTST